VWVVRYRWLSTRCHPAVKKQNTAGDFGTNTVELKLGSERFNGAAANDAVRYSSAISQAVILTYPYSIWSAFSTQEMEDLISELCVHGKYYYAKTKVHRDGGGVTHGQMIWCVDELFGLAENKALEIPDDPQVLGPHCGIAKGLWEYSLFLPFDHPHILPQSRRWRSAPQQGRP
jgi:hypothetical protein